MSAHLLPRRMGHISDYHKLRRIRMCMLPAVLGAFWHLADGYWHAMSSLASWLTALAAIVGVGIAIRELNSIQRQQRFHTYLDLIDLLSRQDSRDARRVIHAAANDDRTGEWVAQFRGHHT